MRNPKQQRLQGHAERWALGERSKLRAKVTAIHDFLTKSDARSDEYPSEALRLRARQQRRNRGVPPRKQRAGERLESADDHERERRVEQVDENIRGRTPATPQELKQDRPR